MTTREQQDEYATGSSYGHSMKWWWVMFGLLALGAGLGALIGRAL